MIDLVQAIYRAFQPVPLTPEQSDLYVNLDDARGEADVVGRLARKIRFAEWEPTCQVLAGHRGSGKSTELLRLKRELATGSPPYFVVYFRADDEVDRNDVDFPDLLIAIVRQLAAQLKKSPTGITLKPGFFRDRIERLKEFFTTPVEFDKLELDLGLATLGGTIKASPNARMEVRKLFEPDTSNWLTAANDVISTAVLELSKQRYAGLVILVDNLDHMVVRLHEASGRMTDEYLFVNRAPQLTAFTCHVVYAMPLSLAFSHHQGTIEQTYGGRPPFVPMTKVAVRPPDNGPYPRGVEKFRQVIAARLRAVAANEQDVFATTQVRDELIQLSGGQPTGLMTIVQDAIVSHGLPINAGSLERVKYAGQRNYARWLREDHWPIIEQIRATGLFNRRERDEIAFRELVEGRAILQYINNEEWYALNPMVTGLTPPTSVTNQPAGRQKPAKKLARRKKKRQKK